MEFVAIDFETALGQDSACQVGIIRVKDEQIVEQYVRLIKPPGNRYSWRNSQVHGLTAKDTENMPTFDQVYPEIMKMIEGKTIVAHNEAFDRKTLIQSLAYYGVDYNDFDLPEKWECTVKIYRQKKLTPNNRLSTLAEKFNIPLNHHDALSDAKACAILYYFHLKNS